MDVLTTAALSFEYHSRKVHSFDLAASKYLKFLSAISGNEYMR